MQEAPRVQYMSCRTRVLHTSRLLRSMHTWELSRW